MKSAKPIIVLVGLMGTGKSTIAWELSQHFQVPCLDTDKLVEQRTGKTVRDIFSDDGEEAFRDLEGDVLRECLHSPDGAVIAGAGGVIVREQNRLELQQRSKRGEIVVVWLSAPVEVLEQRTKKGAHRPLLDQDRHGVLQQMSTVREPLYRQVADVVIDVSQRSPESVASLIIEAIDSVESAQHGRNE